METERIGLHHLLFLFQELTMVMDDVAGSLQWYTQHPMDPSKKMNPMQTRDSADAAFRQVDVRGRRISLVLRSRTSHASSTATPNPHATR